MLRSAVYERVDDDHLTITAYNIAPDGQEGHRDEVRSQQTLIKEPSHPRGRW
jgi:hypothetical protein